MTHKKSNVQQTGRINGGNHDTAVANSLLGVKSRKILDIFFAESLGLEVLAVVLHQHLCATGGLNYISVISSDVLV